MDPKVRLPSNIKRSTRKIHKRRIRQMAKKTKQTTSKNPYYINKKVIAVIVPKEEAEEWKHDIGLGPLAKQLLRAYFAGKIQIEL